MHRINDSLTSEAHISIFNPPSAMYLFHLHCACWIVVDIELVVPTSSRNVQCLSTMVDNRVCIRWTWKTNVLFTITLLHTHKRYWLISGLLATEKVVCILETAGTYNRVHSQLHMNRLLIARQDQLDGQVSDIKDLVQSELFRDRRARPNPIVLKDSVSSVQAKYEAMYGRDDQSAPRAGDANETMDNQYRRIRLPQNAKYARGRLLRDEMSAVAVCG